MLLDIFDPKAPPKVIGIDLGTTNSVVAHVRDSRPVALVNCDGTALLPSVVYYGPRGNVIVGSNAQPFAQREPGRTITSVKRFMGRAADDPQTQTLGAYKFKAPSSEADARVVRFDLGADGDRTAVEVSAEILKSLRQSAVEQLNAVGAAVITVPAYFDDAQRQATKDAARLAGLEVLRLINEPTAAALAYGLEKQQNGVFVVFDLGGGTFDVTILRLEDGIFQVMSTGGDSALGGDDMDRLLAHELLPLMGFELDAAGNTSAPPEIISLALETARSAKHALTDNAEVLLELPKRGGGVVEHRLTRQHFEELIAALLARTGRSCKRALRDASLAPADVDGVILVGGSTRVPQVRAFVAELFGKPPLSDIDPDLVVAYGAALQAELLATSSDEILLLDVLPLSLGIETMGGGVDKVLPRNSTIPVGARSTFTTFADNQTGFEIHVVQGERELAGDCRSLARFTLKGIPPMPAGMARLDVEFHVDADGLLAVHAKELTTGIEQKVEVKPSYGLTDEQVEEMLIAALDFGEADLEARRLADARVEGQRILTATQKALASDHDLLADAERAAVEQAVADLAQAIAGAKQASALQLRVDSLEDVTHAWAGRRMDRAIREATLGQQLGDVERRVEHAQGIEAHLEQSAAKAAEQGRARERVRGGAQVSLDDPKG